MIIKPLPARDVRTELPADLNPDELLFQRHRGQTPGRDWNPWPSPAGERVTQAILLITRRKLAEINAANAIERLA